VLAKHYDLCVGGHFPRQESPDYYAALLKVPDGYRVEAYCHGDSKAHRALSV
jgi:hypothetical protein